MANKKSTKKQKNTNISLIVISAISAVILLVSTVLIVVNLSKADNLVSNGNLDPTASIDYSQPELTGEEIDINDEFFEKIKKHQYQPIPKDKTQTYTMVNMVATYPEDEEYNGLYDIKLPSDWKKHSEPTDKNGLKYSFDASGNSPVYYGISTSPSRITFTNGDVVAKQTLKDAPDNYLKQLADGDPFEILDFEKVIEFEKEINGVKYAVLVEKMNMFGENYSIDYFRILDRGSLERSVLFASATFSIEEDKAYEEIILESIYNLENTLGGFDESKQ